MIHPLPWVASWHLHIVDANGSFVCEAKDEETIQEILSLVNGEPCPLGIVGPSAQPREAVKP